MSRLEKSDLLANSAPASQHYKSMPIEPIQYIEANRIGFHEGNIIKYVSRWKQKDGLDDLFKAKFYIERLIELERAKREPAGTLATHDRAIPAAAPQP